MAHNKIMSHITIMSTTLGKKITLKNSSSWKGSWLHGEEGIMCSNTKKLDGFN